MPRAILQVVFVAAAVAGLRGLDRPTWAAEVTLQDTIYYDGNIDDARWTHASVTVDNDGTIAVAATSNIGPGNQPNVHRARIFLYAKNGTALAEIPLASNTGTGAIAFGPDGMLYSAENWFGAGVHIYDRPGGKNRFVATRHLRGDGSHVDRGSPSSVAITPDLRICTVLNKKVTLLSPDDKIIEQFDWAGHDQIRCAPDGKLYSGNKVFIEKQWKDFKYFILDIARNGKMLVRDGGGWAIYDPAADKVEVAGKFPPNFDVGDAALGPDGQVVLTSRNDPGLAFAVINSDGKILIQRGADFDRLMVSLPDAPLAAASPVAIRVQTVRSRDLGMVPRDRILPADNRPKLQVHAELSPLTGDPLAIRTWHAAALQASGGDYRLTLPATVTGRATLRIAATRTDVPGMRALAVTRDVMLAAPNQAAYVQPRTDRDRIAFAPGRPIRLTVPVSTTGDVDLSGAKVELRDGGRAIWSAPLGPGPMKSGHECTGVVSIPAEITSRLKPGDYTAAVAGLPPSATSGQTPLFIMDTVRPEAFSTPIHTIGPTYGDALLDSQLIADWGATNVTTSAQFDPIYYDILARRGVTAHYQPYGHYAGVHTLPQEQGAAQVWLAGFAQRLEAFPAFTGVEYHDLQVQAWGAWWDAPRKRYYQNEFWPTWAAEVKVPDTVPEANRKSWATGMAVESMLTRLYARLNAATQRVNPQLARTTMQWWHQPLYIADPDDVCKGQTLITAQHMEEQYYHPVTVANMTDLWRRPGMDIWVYGNNSWQEDGTGAMSYTDLMAALFRGAQGVGRNSAPRVGEIRSEFGMRALTPAFQMLHVYGGLSAVAKSADQVAVWRSMFQECCEFSGRKDEQRHQSITTAAYTAFLYAHRTAGIVTDELVRRGALKNYKAVFISFDTPLPEDLAKPLAEFQQAGGIVLANRPLKGFWAPPGAIDLGPAFGDSHAMSHYNRDSVRHIGIEEDGLKGAAVIRQALEGKLSPTVECDEPTTWVSVLESGAARYIWTVNVKRLPQDPADLHRYSGYENTRMPTKSLLRIAKGPYVIYDILGGKRVEPREEDGKWVVTADMSVFPGAIFALLPDAIAAVAVTTGQSAAKELLALQATVQGQQGVIRAAVPLEFTINDAAGKPGYHIHRTAVDGLCHVDLPIAANDVPGRWTITVRELLAGAEFSGYMDVAVPAIRPAATSSTPSVEWGRVDRAIAALAKAHKVAVISPTIASAPRQGGTPTRSTEPLAAAADAVVKQLAAAGKQVIRLSPAEYLADLDTLKWKGFPEKHGENGDFGKIQPRAPRYDLVITLETPQHPTGVVKPDLLPIVLSATDPGPGRGLVQFVAMPVYNDEDAVCLAGGDLDGVLAAVAALAHPPTAAPKAPPQGDVRLSPNAGAAGKSAPPGLAGFIGIGVSELAVSADGRRVAAGLRGWGNNLIVLDQDGKVIGKDASGKFFPMDLRRAGDGFAVISTDNDPTTQYLKLYDASGKPTARLAAMGRRIGGVRDCTPCFFEIMTEKFLPQAVFTVSDDLSLAGAGGSNGIAVWDVPLRKLLWRDDAVHYRSPELGSTQWADVSSFPQIRLSGDGKRLVLQHQGRVFIRDARTGQVLHELRLPPGSESGRVQVFDGKRLVIGGKDFYGFQIAADGRVEPLWHYRAPKSVTAATFAPDGVRYAIGEVDGTLRIMRGGGQEGGYTTPEVGGAYTSLDFNPAIDRLAFATTSGYVGVLGAFGQPVWQAKLPGPAVVRFASNDGVSIVGDGRGSVHWFDGAGGELRNVNLTALVWRDDLPQVLTRDDPTPTLRVGPSPAEQQLLPVPQGVPNLATSAKITALAARSWWNEPTLPDRSVSLNDGKKDAPANGWYDRTKLEYLAFVPSPPGWEIVWDKPVTIDTVVAYESPDHPEAVPSEVRIDAWIDDNWKEVAHTWWNSRTTHVHGFPAVTTAKIRYVPVGDLAHNLYLSEIEVYKAQRR